MEETKEQQSLHRFLQFGIYLSVLIEIFLFFYAGKLMTQDYTDKYSLRFFAIRLARIPFYHQLLYSKLFTLLLICLVSVGTLSRKKKDLNPKNQIVYPLAAGLVIFFSGIWFQGRQPPAVWMGAGWYDLAYIASAIAGTLLIHVAMDNISKMISSRLGKDKWNVEGESFMQPVKPIDTPYSVNIPMLFYYKNKVRKGFIPLSNLFRSLLLISVPGGGKTFSVIIPVIKQFIAKSFTLCVYDIKYPDLAKVAYYHYLLAKQKGKCLNYKFHVLNLNDPEKSERVNPWKRKYLNTLADASETAEALVEAMKKGDKSGGSDQFFTQSAINFLAACIYFFSSYEGGRYSSLPHVLSFLNLSYEEIFSTLFSEPELVSLLSAFRSAYNAKAFDQLEGQVGTLKIFISRLATKETYWVFSGDDFELKISDPKNPSILVLANDPLTQSINSACYSVVLNRVTKLVNTKGNLPVGLVIDEAPSLYIFRIEQVLSQARSNLVASVLGIQSLQQFQQQYGKETAATITSVVGNVLSGSVQNKDTLEWLERLFGKVKQQSESLSIDRNKTSLSLSEKLEPLIPAGKIAALRAGEMVGMLAADAVADYTGKFEPSAVHCRINLDMEAIKKEEQSYRDLPVYYDFNGKKEEILRQNFYRINQEVQQLVKQFRPAQPSAAAPQPKGMMKQSFKK
ncbi:TraM-binding TraD/TraG-like protein [Arcticibacter tournemirensis]|uniref:Type IV secretory system conjugative DNA transfer family protein n=1 Tax=Arcticibacter tournemirensis TaxID=699437 RepID=A0A5M9GSI5_9SPHI|nr:TraM recognition domain-containing protein [Arcticibacter tournemirensis]KAA8476839.1 type IV secretory system conjugative DNA transfer family protein [Arcticibacter tournemirensis]TQM49592.1 TraM-binding TraD/TraG-like protein [Arcticibacter tournemirensis]